MGLMRNEILDALCASPRVVERLLRVFPHDRLDVAYGKAKLTPREAIASLADNEVIILDRIRMANLKPGSSVESMDPVEMAKAKHYSEKNPFHEAEVFESRRMTTVDYLRELHDEAWSKTFVLGGYSITIREYVTIVLANDLFHLDQLSQHVATEVATIA